MQARHILRQYFGPITLEPGMRGEPWAKFRPNLRVLLTLAAGVLAVLRESPRGALAEGRSEGGFGHLATRSVLWWRIWWQIWGLAGMVGDQISSSCSNLPI